MKKSQMSVSHSLWSVLVAPRQPRQLEIVRLLYKVGVIGFVFRQVLENPIRNFVSSRLASCNGLFLSRASSKRRPGNSQFIQNAADTVRRLSGMQKSNLFSGLCIDF